MFEWFRLIFDTSGFPPRWKCGEWSDIHGWTHVISDVAVFGAYVAIPIALAYFVRQRPAVPFPRLFWRFSLFIMTCGLTHLVEATIFWNPWYRFSAVLKVCTAIASWATVMAMLPQIPRALRFRSPADLEAEVYQRTQQLADVNELLHGKNEELEQFIYTISHDLKTPLVTTRGFLGELKRDLGTVESEDVQDAIYRIDRATDRMGQLLDDLLDLSRIGRVPTDPQWLNIFEMIDDIRAALKPELTALNSHIAVDGKLPQVYVDAKLARQLFDNLIVNAMKYGVTDSQKTITIRGRETAEHSVIQVVDNGPGIPADMREKVFLPFERLSIHREGTGVGLAVVARVVAVVGGSVQIEDTQGGGTTFTILFPRPSAE